MGSPGRVRASAGAHRFRPMQVAWASLAFLVPLIVSLPLPLRSVDLTYHLRAGDLILDSGSIPQFDTFTFSVAGTAWLDQQWGAQIILSLIHRAGGWPTLAFLQALLIGTTFFLVWAACRTTGASARVSTFLSLGGFAVASPALLLRPQLLGLPLFAAGLWLVAGRDRYPRAIWLLPGLAAASANLHGSFPLFPAIVALAWLDDRIRDAPHARRTLLVAGATTAATLINPFGLAAWRYVFELTANPTVRDGITEWLPPTVTSMSGALMFTSMLGLMAYLAKRRGPVPTVPLITLGVFLLMALAAQRAVVWWAMIAPVAVAQIYSTRGVDRGASPRPRDEPEEHGREPAAPAIVLIATLSLVAVALLPWWRGASYVDHVVEAPAGLTRAVAQELPEGTNLFNYQPWGSWFEFATPHVQVFVDSRIEILPQSVWDDYFEVATAKLGWREVLDRWAVEAIVAKKEAWELIPTLRADPGWRLVFEDEDGVLFVRS